MMWQECGIEVLTALRQAVAFHCKFVIKTSNDGHMSTPFQVILHDFIGVSIQNKHSGFLLMFSGVGTS